MFANVTLVPFSRWCGACSGSPQQHSHPYIYATLCCNDVLLEIRVWLVKNLGQAENIGDDKTSSHNTLTNRSADLLHNDSS